jgi:hypothetical protein
MYTEVDVHPNGILSLARGGGQGVVEHLLYKKT